MDDIVNLLPIAAFIALAAGLAVVLRGTGRIVARTREVELFRGSVKDLAARVDASLGGAAGQIDAVRRRQVGPDTIVDTIDAAKDAVARYIEEAKAIRGPRKAQRIRSDAIVLDDEPETRAPLLQRNHHVGRVRVFVDVVQRLLRHAIEMGLDDRQQPYVRG